MQSAQEHSSLLFKYMYAHLYANPGQFYIITSRFSVLDVQRANQQTNLFRNKTTLKSL